MSRKVCIYNTDDVIDKEMDAFKAKYGRYPDEEDARKFLDEELEHLRQDIETNGAKEFCSRLENTIEDEDRNIWICLKLFKINRFWKMYGIEPE